MSGQPHAPAALPPQTEVKPHNLSGERGNRNVLRLSGTELGPLGRQCLCLKRFEALIANLQAEIAYV